MAKAPITVGMSYFSSEVSLGNLTLMDENGKKYGLYHSYEKYNNLTFSTAVDYYLRFSALLRLIPFAQDGERSRTTTPRTVHHEPSTGSSRSEL